MKQTHVKTNPPRLRFRRLPESPCEELRRAGLEPSIENFEAYWGSWRIILSAERQCIKAALRAAAII